MILESADNYESRNYPEMFGASSEVMPKNNLSWKAKLDIEHNNRWETDEAYRQNCIENEVEYQRRKEKDLHY